MSGSPPRLPLIAILGATGTGKSKLAVDLALQLNGEVINGDAMQLYDGAPIITNKIPVAERRSVPHHLLGCVALGTEPWNVEDFNRNALEVIDGIRSRGRLPILVGGTHYYTQSLLFEVALVDNEVNIGAEEQEACWPRGDHQILETSTEIILKRLEEVDPVMAARWHPKDRRKIQRSLEIYLRTGRRASDIYQEQHERRLTEQQKCLSRDTDESTADGLRFPTLMFWVYADHAALRARLEKRVDTMLTKGLLEEVRLLDHFVLEQECKGLKIDKSRGIWSAIGYKEFEAYTNATAENCSSPSMIQGLKEAAIEQVKSATRQYAKRQITWIRNKLWNDLSATKASDRLFLLDGNNLSTWDENVRNPAIEIAESFLSGHQLPDPSELSAAASGVLSRATDHASSGRQTSWVKKTCSTCGVTVMIEQDWQRHLQSRRHRNATEARSKGEIPIDKASSSPD